VKLAVLGSTGQLGSDLVRAFTEASGYRLVPITHAQVEVTDSVAVSRAIGEICPDIVVNCAAFHRVDECEDRPAEAFGVNSVGALHVARACAEVNALCVYISTDYVFDGEKGRPYTESDAPSPINAYGASKLAGEHLVRQTCPRWLIIRVASLFGKAGARGKGGNFVETILAGAKEGRPLRVVNDIRMSPTYTYDAALALVRLVRQGATGLVHVTNAGACTWHEFARKALELVGSDTKVESISSSDYPAKARRPRDSSLRSGKFPARGLRPWEEALMAYLVEKGWLA
jgi:dTDP-4-dehydrorhamnose reductase